MAHPNSASDRHIHLSNYPTTYRSTLEALSEDILVIIFLEYFESFERKGPRLIHDHNFKPYAYIRISHICCRWRRVALQTPLLWRRIVVTDSDDWLGILITRTREATISIEADYSQSRVIRALQLIKQHRHRIRALDLTLSLAVYPEALIQLAAPFPALESLTVRRSFEDTVQSSTLSFPLSALTTHWPHLQRFEAQMFRISSTEEEPAALKTLILTGRARGHAELEYVVLKRFHQLQTLELVSVTPLYFYLPVDLPYLKHLYIDCQTYNTIAFLDAVRIPKSATIDVRGVHDASEAALKSLGRRLATMFHERLNIPKPLVNWSIVLDVSYGSFAINASPKGEALWDHLAESPFRVSQERTFVWHSGDIGQELRWFCASFPLEEVTQLMLQLDTSPAYPLPPPSMLASTFLRMRNVESLALTMSGVTLDYIQSFLTEPLDPNHKQQHQSADLQGIPLIFPSLRHLKLVEVEFISFLPLFSGVPPSRPSESKQFDALLSTLTYRKDCGPRAPGIESLVLDQCCGLTADNVEQLRQVVQEVQETSSTTSLAFAEVGRSQTRDVHLIFGGGSDTDDGD